MSLLNLDGASRYRLKGGGYTQNTKLNSTCLVFHEEWGRRNSVWIILYSKCEHYWKCSQEKENREDTTARTMNGSEE